MDILSVKRAIFIINVDKFQYAYARKYIIDYSLKSGNSYITSSIIFPTIG